MISCYNPDCKKRFDIEIVGSAYCTPECKDKITLMQDSKPKTRRSIQAIQARCKELAELSRNKSSKDAVNAFID